MSTDIGRWLLRSSGAHWDRELAVQVQQCPRRGGEEEAAAEEAEAQEAEAGVAESYVKI